MSENAGKAGTQIYLLYKNREPSTPLEVTNSCILSFRPEPRT